MTLGTSDTGCHAYAAYIHRKPVIFCSNDYYDELKSIKNPSDIAYLKENVVVLDVPNKLYEPAPQGVN